MPISIEEQIKRTGIDVSYPGEDSMKLSFESPLGYNYSVQIDFEDGTMRSARGDGSLNKHIVIPRINEVVRLHEGEVDSMAKNRIKSGEANTVADILKDCQEIQNKFVNMNSLVQTLDEYNKAVEMAADSDKAELYSTDVRTATYRTAVRGYQEKNSFDTYTPGGAPDDSDLHGEFDIALNTLNKKLSESVAPGMDIVAFQYSTNPDRISVRGYIDGNDLSNCVKFLDGMQAYGTPITLYVDKQTGELECSIRDRFTNVEGKMQFRRMTPDFTEELREQFLHDMSQFPVEDIMAMTQPIGPELADAFGIEIAETKDSEHMKDDIRSEHDSFSKKFHDLEKEAAKHHSKHKAVNEQSL